MQHQPPKANGKPEQFHSRVLYVQGIPDNGMIRISTYKPNASSTGKQMAWDFKNYSVASMITQHIPGSLSHFKYVNLPGVANETLVLVGDQNQVLKFTAPQAIVNCIVDPDITSQALVKMKNLIKQAEAQYKKTIPVINPPEGIQNTTRDKIYTQFKDLPGLHIPRVIRIAPSSVKDTVAKIKEAGIRLPCLIRMTGSHGGKELQLITNWTEEELARLERYAFDGREFYVTEWVDFKSKDGLYRKSRLVFVGERLIPRHRIISDSWNAHAESRKTLMAEKEELRNEEQKFLQQPIEKSISPAALQSLRKIRETLGLEYLGIDCNVDDDGNLTIFEINAAVNTMVQEDLNLYKYLVEPMQTIIQLFNDLVADKIVLKRAA